MTELNSWHTVLLDRRRNVVARKLNILHHYRVQACVLKLANGSNTDIALLMDIKGGKAVKVSPNKCGVQVLKGRFRTYFSNLMPIRTWFSEPNSCFSSSG